MIGQLEHLTRLALRPSAYKAHILVLAFLLFLAFTVCRLFILFYFILCYVHNLDLIIIVKVVV